MAQRGLNKICLIGRLGKDPEVRYTKESQPIVVFSIATSEVWKDKESGETKEKTQWHRIVTYNKLAEITAEQAQKGFLKKGTQVYIEGRLQTRKWQDNSGAERQSTEVVIDINGMLQILGNKPNQLETTATEIDEV